MIEAVMFWNEPNNKSHWDFQLDPEWRLYGQMVKLAADAVAAENPSLLRVLEAPFLYHHRRAIYSSISVRRGSAAPLLQWTVLTFLFR